ncbi:MAG: hypothetical protein EBU84_15610 [Actinobacteria bacterium]|nr:hypothetical protein [Actinomycetota bacterium]
MAFLLPVIRHRRSKTLASGQKPRYILSMNLFLCSMCNGPVDPDGPGVAHLVTAWVKSGKTTVLKVKEKQYQYAHSICVETSGKTQQAETLF